MSDHGYVNVGWHCWEVDLGTEARKIRKTQPGREMGSRSFR